jgi:UDPglucose 6-dehydrogenase
VRLAIIGTGYVGLVTGVCLAHLGHEVTCVDTDGDKVDAINAGRCPIHEAGLSELLTSVLGRRFTATTDLRAAMAGAEVTVIAVGTPFGEDRIDLSQIVTAAEEVGAALASVDGYHVVVVKSTVVPGTTEDVVRPALERSSGRRVGEDLGLAMNPEFLREGLAVEDFLEPDRIVLGGVDERTLDALDRVYAVYEDAAIMHVSPRTAEMIKYASNAALAMLISFSNEIGNLSAELGVDGRQVLEGVHLDRRWSPVVDGQRVSPGILTYLAAGCGFGGSCFPKDVHALLAHGEAAGVSMPLLTATLAINAEQPGVLVDRLRRHVDLTGARVAVLGAAFKPGTDDVRESPTLRIVPELVDAGAQVVLHDPVALDNARAVLGSEGIDHEPRLDRAVDGVDAILLVTAWPEYLQLPTVLDGRAVPVVDGRRMLDPTSVRNYDGVAWPWAAPSGDGQPGTVAGSPAVDHGQLGVGERR